MRKDWKDGSPSLDGSLHNKLDKDPWQGITLQMIRSFDHGTWRCLNSRPARPLCGRSTVLCKTSKRERERERKKIEREQASPVSFFCSPFSPTKSFDWLGYETMFWDHQSTKRCSRAWAALNISSESPRHDAKNIRKRPKGLVTLHKFTPASGGCFRVIYFERFLVRNFRHGLTHPKPSQRSGSQWSKLGSLQPSSFGTHQRTLLYDGLLLFSW